MDCDCGCVGGGGGGLRRALVLACKQGDVRTLRVLRATSCCAQRFAACVFDTSAHHNKLGSPFHAACAAGHVGIVRFCLEAGVRPACVDPEALSAALVLAAYCDALDVVVCAGDAAMAEHTELTRQQAIALGMGRHGRLGAGSVVRTLPAELVEAIGRWLLPRMQESVPVVAHAPPCDAVAW